MQPDTTQLASLVLQVEELSRRRKALSQNADALGARSAAFRSYLTEMLGYMPPRSADLSPCSESERQVADGVLLETLTYQVESGRRMGAEICRPMDDSAPYPGVLLLHSWDLNKAGVESARVDLARAGYVVLSPGNPCAHGSGHGASDCPNLVDNERTVVGMITFDNMRALDYLSSRADVASDRIACVGMCWSGLQSYLLAALDERVRVTCPVCGVSTNGAMATHNTFISGHNCIDTFVPDLLQVAQVQDIMALIAPRPLLLQNNVDHAWAPILGFDRAEAEISAVYEALGHPDCFQTWNRHSDLDLTSQFTGRIIAWLDRFLKPNE